MADVMPSHHGRNGGNKPPRHPPSTFPVDCEFASPPKRKQHYKSLTVFQLYDRLRGFIPI